MPDRVFGPLILRDEIGPELRARTQVLEFKTVSASKWPLIMEKVAIEEKEGWDKYKRNNRSYKLAREKPLDEQLEDEVWCILANMGFTEMSSSRNFRIETKRDPNPRQIDVFAKDDDVALLVECTHAAKPTKSSAKDINGLIEKISDYKGRIFNAVTAYYGQPAKLKPKFIIATRNVEWGQADLEKCAKEGVAVLADVELDYYRELTKHLRVAARYQLLAHVFGGTEVPNLQKNVPATQGSMGGVNFYNFLISPEELLKISYVGHKASRELDSLETYQRLLHPKRLKAIAAYIDDGGKFPTNIVVNFKTARNRKLVYQSSSPKNEASFGTLTLPNTYGSAWVIDGQHRLYGYAYRNLKKGPKNDNSVVSVLAFENLPPADEMNLFIDINSKQVKVRTSLLIELYADLHWNSSNLAERLLALQARIVGKLNNDRTSPIYDRVEVTGKTKNAFRCLTQTTISEGIRVSRVLGTVRSDIFYPGPIAHHDPKKFDRSLDKAAGVISDTLQLFKDAMPEHWEAGDRAGVGYLCTNIGIRAVILVMADICQQLGRDSNSDLSTWTREQVSEEIKEYMQPLVDYFAQAKPEDIMGFRKIGSSLAGVKKQSMEMNLEIQKKFPNYIPEGLQAYVSNRSQSNTDKATIMINEVERRLHHFTINTLKTELGTSWWVSGIPHNLRLKITQAWETEDRSRPEEAYLYLINYQDIAITNWNLLGEAYALGNKDIGNPKKCVEWIGKLNDVRQTTHHSGSKGFATNEQVKLVEEIHEKVCEYFPQVTV